MEDLKLITVPREKYAGYRAEVHRLRAENKELRGALSIVPGQIDHRAMWTEARATISRLRAENEELRAHPPHVVYHPEEVSALRAENEMLKTECASISEEFGLPPTIRPADGEIRRILACLRAENVKLNTELHGAVVALLESCGRPGARAAAPKSVLYDEIIPRIESLRAENERLLAQRYAAWLKGKAAGEHAVIAECSALRFRVAELERLLQQVRDEWPQPIGVIALDAIRAALAGGSLP